MDALGLAGVILFLDELTLIAEQGGDGIFLVLGLSYRQGIVKVFERRGEEGEGMGCNK